MQQPRRLLPALLLGALWPYEFCASDEFEVVQKYQQQGGQQSLAVTEPETRLVQGNDVLLGLFRRSGNRDAHSRRAVALGPCGTAGAPAPSRPP